MLILMSHIGVTISMLLAVTLADDTRNFPQNFLFGAASASYQIEGAWNLSGKGENIWDRATHTHSDWIVDRSSGDVACDSYHHYKDDIAALKSLKVNVYRFSISWSRIFPTGDVTVINQPGIDYYNNLIIELLCNGIQPMVTMYHWDLPQPLQDLGGWANPLLADYFEDYAKMLFVYFGKHVRWWITINEPAEICKGYSDGAGSVPGINASGVGDYLAAHTILQAHARTYRLYKKEFYERQGGRVGIALNSQWYEPLTNTVDDVEAARRGIQFELGWFAHPIYSKTGDYPPVMRELIDQNSLQEGRFRSRLPRFDSKYVEYIRGSYDFFGLNHYTTSLVAAGKTGPSPSFQRDTKTKLSQDPKWPSSASSWLKVVPWGFRKLLQWIKYEYNNPPIFVTENGFSDHGEIEDKQRIAYYTSYLDELLKAIHVDSCDVIGYAAWSVMDNFEWTSGYIEKFGLYSVNFSDPARSRRAKASSYVMAQIFHTRRLPEESEIVSVYNFTKR